ncbi:CpaF family protein [Pseudobdellovibrio exovorus]|uniref:Bacterial type II secretion system protein E domain-containing protein n=1 Tax=Pseudobdellovibrio exovorus JSS TaxID=1184267 RepID=M4VU95_9BACT|nr:ATPase, T2SS/T4P/T4SS family [Pseudobdellovibrio exovorus]AGH96784.1 hypothetical protein A11Q_2568 [Pseudobdellovibrio exovorus JSS]
MAIDFGPIKSLMDSSDISEVMINAWSKIYAEHKGLLIATSAKFIDARQFEELLHSILAADKKDPQQGLFFDGVIHPYGYRYNITFPPMSPRGPSLTIRKFNVKNFTLQDLIKSDFISGSAAQFLHFAVQSRLSIIISGGTGSGKTSFLNTLGSMIPQSERIVSIEDVAELRLNHPNWLPLQAVRQDVLGETRSVTPRDCLVNALRMRPDRIIVGECRKDETFDMLQAMNTGHDGSMTTVHGNTPSEALLRLESLVQFSGIDLPIRHLRMQMSKGIDLVIQIRRRADGKREVSEIIELTGMEGEVISRSPIYERNRNGELASVGYVPRSLDKINREKTLLPASHFTKPPTSTNPTVTKKAS